MRASRAVLTSLGISLGIAALLGSVTMAESASASIKGRLEEAAVTTVSVRLDLAQREDPLGVIEAAEANLRSIAHVVSVGSSVDLTDVVSPPLIRPDNAERPIAATVLAVSPQFPTAVSTTGARKALTLPFANVGMLVADLLSIGASREATIFVGGRPFPLATIAPRGAVDRRVDGAVQVSLASAQEYGWLPYVDEALIVVRTTPGRAEDVASIAAIAASPQDVELADVSVAPDPRRLREGIEADTLLLVSGLALLLVVVGLFSIANVMLTNVMERTGEIGLRRALGASRGDIAVILLTEAAAIGFVGGCVGVLIGTGGSVAVALFEGWPIDIEYWRLGVAPLGGGLIGCVAGAYPARRAARLDPVVALQR